MNKITAIAFALLLGFSSAANAAYPKLNDRNTGHEFTPLIMALGCGDKVVTINGTQYAITLEKRFKKESKNSPNKFEYKELQKEYKSFKDKTAYDRIYSNSMREGGVELRYLKTDTKKGAIYEITYIGDTRTFSLKEKTSKKKITKKKTSKKKSPRDNKSSKKKTTKKTPAKASKKKTTKKQSSKTKSSKSKSSKSKSPRNNKRSKGNKTSKKKSKSRGTNYSSRDGRGIQPGSSAYKKRLKELKKQFSGCRHCNITEGGVHYSW